MHKSNISVLTLDAGGTNFVFSAYKNNTKLVETITFPAIHKNLDECLMTMVNGFKKINNKIGNSANIISIGFPGPADYKQGIIGDLHNIPAFRGGVPLRNILSDKFNMPVFINNDANLYALGEALTGSLPDINALLAKNKNTKKYENLIGLTLGTGLGGGIVSGNKMLTGDNSIAAEICLLSNRVNQQISSEEGISIRALKRNYSSFADININNVPEPREMFKICEGKHPGDKSAAIKSFELLGMHLGDVVANLITVIDGIVVIGGGIAGAQKYIIPGLKKELNLKFNDCSGNKVNRLMQEVYFLNEKEDLIYFLKDTSKEIKVPDSKEKLQYEEKKKTGILFSKYNTSDMIHCGAYQFAVTQNISR